MSVRKMTPRGNMTRGANSGPAVMLMPPHIRATFMPPPPLKSIPPIKHVRKHPITGVVDYLNQFEKTKPKERVSQPTPKMLKEKRIQTRQADQREKLQPLIDEYRKEQRDCEGKYQGMNCYNTLFVGRLAYEVTERKLLREMETFGTVRDIKLVVDKEGKSKGYAFVEYENEDDMKRAYRAADGMKIEGRAIVVDVERGHTVPTFLPRRLGGGLGGTRLGGKDKNIKAPGRYDPSRPDLQRPVGPPIGGPPDGIGPPYGGGAGHDHRNGPYGGVMGGGFRDPLPPPPYGGYGGAPPQGRRDWGGSDRGGPGSDSGRRRRRSRSRSPDRRYAPRPRY